MAHCIEINVQNGPCPQIKNKQRQLNTTVSPMLPESERIRPSSVKFSAHFGAIRHQKCHSAQRTHTTAIETGFLHHPACNESVSD